MSYYHLKSKDIVSFTNNMKRLSAFIILLNIFIITKDKDVVYCQEISSNIEGIRHIPSNLTDPPEDISRIDRSHRGNDIEYKFFIRANTIIRTGESRALGAKYLNETRLPSNHDCLMWCLETPTCNAAVYEEKNMQSCYMFDCGSPAKPLCKFTVHNFFTSSVLKMSQHSYELSQWGKQVQQERDNLEQNQSGITSTTILHSEIINTVSTSPVPSVKNEQPGKKGSICHHYQFQCVNSSECIAIYNVCDGIPQCPDGSDESSELKCPGKGFPKEVPNNKIKAVDVQPTLENKTPALKQEPPPIHPSVPYSGLQNVPSYKKPLEHKEMQHKDFKAIWPGSYPGSPITKPVSQYHHHIEDSDGLGSPFIHKHSQFISANDPHVQNLNRWASDYDQYPSHSTSAEQYGPYDRIDEQYLSNQIPPDYDTGKSFTGYHQDDIPYWPSQDILQDNSYTVDEFPQPGVQNLNKVIGYPDKENAYAQQITRTAEQYPEAKLSMHSKPLLNSNQASDMDDYKLSRYPHSRQQSPYIALEDSLQQHYSNYPEMKPKSFNSMQNADDTLYNNDDLIRASIVNQLPKKLDQIHHQPEHEMKHLNKDMLHPVSKAKKMDESTEASRDNSFIVVNPTSHSKAIQRTVLDFKMSVAELYQSSSTHTHEANSAILALVLGVTISFFLIILLACRMKTLRRRMSRKGRSLAHDADYLVNGMYL